MGFSKLDALIEQAFQASPTLASARATLRQAQEIHAAQEGAMMYPQVDAGFSAQRQRFNPIVLGQDGQAREFSLFNAGVNVNYQLDLAGGNRRALEALAAQTEYCRHELEGAQLTLAGNIVTAAITQARLTAQIQSTEVILRAQDEQLYLTQERVRLGQGAPDEVLALQTQVEQTRAGLPVLRKQSQQNEHLLAALTGRAPGDGRLPAFTLEEFTLPSDLPLIVPSELVRRRPDILGAEALLHAANAEYGSAIAKLYPQLNLSADLATQTLVAGALFGPGSAIWSVLGQLTQPLFNPALPAESARHWPRSMQLRPITKASYSNPYAMWPMSCAHWRTMPRHWQHWLLQMLRHRALCNPCRGNMHWVRPVRSATYRTTSGATDQNELDRGSGAAPRR